MMNAREQAPTQAQISRFIEVFEELDRFEATNRFVRGYGAFKESELGDESTIAVMAWLKGLRDNGHD